MRDKDSKELPDQLPVRQLPSLQLLILPFCAPEEIVWNNLRFACDKNRVQEVTHLLHKPLDPNGRGADTDPSPLHLAANKGHLKVVQLLLEAGADKSVAMEDGATALFLAAQNGHLKVVQLLLEAGAGKDVALADGTTALFVAAQKGHLEVVGLLLEAGADKNVAMEDGATALFPAAQNGHLKVVQLLLEAGAGKDVALADGTTALFVAAQKGHLEVVGLLLEAGADKNVAMEDGATALFVAAQNGHLKVVATKWLLGWCNCCAERSRQREWNGSLLTCMSSKLFYITTAMTQPRSIQVFNSRTSLSP